MAFDQSIPPFRNSRNAGIVKEPEDYRVIQTGEAMNTHVLNRARRIVITEAFIDYIEQCYEDQLETNDILTLINEHFDDFVLWAYDDILISSKERDLLLNGLERELIEGIKTETARSFSFITEL